MGNNFEYILRFAIQPGYRQEENLQDVIDYCKRAQIKEIMFHINGEELFLGNPKRVHVKPWLDMIQGFMPRLKEEGIDVSLNPWTTFGQQDRGRQLEPGDDFTTMVDKNGRVSTCTGCPLDDNFTDYLADLYGFYATIKPKQIWIEDDFRLHNHIPLEWGGCFCEKHMAAYSRYLGRKVEREEFVNGLLAEGGPNEYREAWLHTNREAMIRLAEKLTNAVKTVSSQTTMGLMCSIPYVHASEWRDWKRLVTALGEGAIVRPHLPAYTELSGIQYFSDYHTVTLQTMQLLPQDVSVCPELENFPYTSFNKSDKTAAFQTELCAVTGCDGLTLNIFSMFGGGVDPDEDFDQDLNVLKPYCDALCQVGLDLNTLNGVYCLFSQESSAFLQISTAGDFHALYPHECFWPGFLQRLGICAIPSINTEIEGAVVAVSGQLFRSLTEEQIVRLFEKNTVLLEGEAARTLCDLGFGKLAGIQGYTVIPVNNADNCYEEAVDGNAYNKRVSSRMTCMHVGDYINIEYVNPPEIIATVRRFDGHETGIGTARYKNVIVLPYQVGLPNGQNVTHLLSPTRRDLLQKQLQDSGIAMVKCQTNVGIYEYDRCVCVVNSGLDTAENVQIKIRHKGSLSELLHSGQTEKCASFADDEGWLNIGSIPALSTRTFVY